MTPIPLGILALAGITGGAGAFDLLETTTLSTSASSVTFSGLGAYSDYKHLQVRWVARTNRSDTTDSLIITFNSDTATNYAWHRLIGSGSSVSSSAFTARNQIQLGILPGNNATADTYAAGVTDILDFNSADKNATVRTLSGIASSDLFVQLSSGLWIDTAAVTSMELSPSNGTELFAGTRMSIYGVK
jgi:hypothetical protein